MKSAVKAELQNPSGKLLSLDVSFSHIGVAVCDPLQLMARPLLVINRRSRDRDFAHLAKLVVSEEVQAVICGLPFNMDESESERTVGIRTWAMKLAQALRALLGKPMPVIFWDERLTTFAANELRREMWNRGERHIVEEDAAAAAVILQSYLDCKHNGELRDFGQIVLPAKT